MFGDNMSRGSDLHGPAQPIGQAPVTMALVGVFPDLRFLSATAVRSETNRLYAVTVHESYKALKIE